MRPRTLVRALFLVAAAHDGILGMAFLVAPRMIYDRFGVTHPNHFGYVQFAAALLIVFGIMFLQVAMDPVRSRNLIPYGILLKVSYCAVTFGHWFLGAGVPDMWKPFAIIDVVFAVFFVWAYRVSRPRR